MKFVRRKLFEAAKKNLRKLRDASQEARDKSLVLLGGGELVFVRPDDDEDWAGHLESGDGDDNEDDEWEHMDVDDFR